MLKNKVFMITGASRGIGKAIAINAAENGADIAVIYNGSQQKAEEICEEIRSLGRKCEIYKCDVTQYQEVGNTIKKIISDMGKIDVLVNNAGVTKDGLLLTMKENDFDFVIDTNLKGAFNTTKQILRYMIKQKGGSIVNITSVSGMMGNPGQANYSSAKAGLIGFTKTVAKEVGRAQIRCNAVAPGFVKTDMTDKLPKEIRNNVSEAVPLGKMAETDDIANAVIFLASDKAKYITGEVLKVDGGLYI